MCGEQPSSNQKSEGWNDIPISQSSFLLRSFLQRRGYFFPSFKQTSNTVIVDPGHLTHVSSIRVSGAPPQFDISRKRDVVGEPLTSALLDDVDRWTRKELGHLGYPCSEVKLHGDSDTGVISIEVLSSGPSYLNSIRVKLLENPAPDKFSQVSSDLDAFLRRYDAFKMGTVYDADLLAISADRAITDGIVEKTFFTPHCDGKSHAVDQYVIPGKSRIFSLGFGLNTEEVVILKASIKRVQIGTHSSSALAEIRTSWKLQQISAFYDWNFVSPSSPTLIRAFVETLHRNENPYEFYSERALLGYGTREDFQTASFGLLAGPQFQVFQTLRGVAPSNPYDLGLSVDFRLMSHQYEFNRTQLNGGYRLIFQGKLNHPDFVSNFGAAVTKVQGERIWNIGNYDPPLILVNFRGGYTLAIPIHGNDPSRLPPDYQQFLGGMADLRGFGRLELPSNSTLGVGGLSSAYFTIELRPGLFGESIQPILFSDLGAIGLTSYSPQAPLYGSPGIGLSWKSPIGPVRSTLAHGFTLNPQSGSSNSDSHWQFLLVLGEPL